MADEIPQATSISEIQRRGRSVIALTLPETGAVVHIRRAQVMDLVAQGLIPDHLTPAVLKGQDLEESADTTREFIEVVDAVCCAVMVEPRMQPAGMPAIGDALTPADLPLIDRIYVHQVAKRAEGVFHLARFPGEPAGGVAPVADESGVPDPAVEPGGGGG